MSSVRAVKALVRPPAGREFSLASILTALGGSVTELYQLTGVGWSSLELLEVKASRGSKQVSEREYMILWLELFMSGLPSRDWLG